jgi:hypothetical protein
MAAHAAAELGHDIKIVSKKRKSEMYGAQYLHRPIPGLDSTMVRGTDIAYELRGSVEGYRDKVYGRTYSGNVSPQDLDREHKGWNIRTAYDDLWDMYAPFVVDMPVRATDLLPEGAIGSLGADLVISSLPAPVLCLDMEGVTQHGHAFEAQEVWAIGDAPERGVFNPITVPKNTVVCNGEPDVGWYRTANVFGRSTTEWPLKRKPPVEGVALVAKPLKTTCTCQPNVRRVGRYGRWEKGVLAHTAYYDTNSLLVQQGYQEELPF